MQRETPAFTLSLENNNYYLVELKEHVEFDIPELLELIELQKEICNRVLPVLVVCSSTASASSDFIKYLSKNEHHPLCNASAYVIKSITQHLLAHFFKLFITPERPTAFFKKKEDAIKWMEQFFEEDLTKNL